MRKIDPTHYSSSQVISRITPESVNLGVLPPIEPPNVSSFPADAKGERLNTRTPAQVNTRTGERPNSHTDAHLNWRTPEQVNTTPSPTNRPIKRCSFNLYTDQMRELSRIAFETEKDKSELVRAMLDDYLKANR
jgi:hypothetical protein